MSSRWREAARGSERAFVERASAYLPALLGFARRLTGSGADAEDLVQETLVRAIEKRGGLREPAQLKAWLLAIERSTWLNSRRGLRATLEVLDGGLDDPARRAEPSGDLERELLARSLGDGLLKALQSLPEDWRQALWLREVEELSYDEIAGVMGCPVGTVRSRLARARAAMLERMQEERRRGL